MSLETKQDLYDLSNGAILQYNGSEYMKIKTDKDRYGSPEGIIVLDIKNNEEMQFRSVNDGILLLDSDTAFFRGETDSVTEIEHTDTDKQRLQEYINTLY